MVAGLVSMKVEDDVVIVVVASLWPSVMQTIAVICPPSSLVFDA